MNSREKHLFQDKWVMIWNYDKVCCYEGEGHPIHHQVISPAQQAIVWVESEAILVWNAPEKSKTKEPSEEEIKGSKGHVKGSKDNVHQILMNYLSCNALNKINYPTRNKGKYILINYLQSTLLDIKIIDDQTHSTSTQPRIHAKVKETEITLEFFKNIIASRK